jgi:adenylate kinase
MRITVTGTPGTGKTTATDLLGEDPTDECETSVVHLNDIIREEGLYTDTDAERDSLITDFDRVADWLDENDYEEVSVVESHLAHHFDAERVVVLRCHPETLEERLRERGESDAKVSENAEAEALDVILTEAVDRHGEESVYEIDTTDHGPTAVAREIESVIAGEREPSAGEVNFVGYL